MSGSMCINVVHMLYMCCGVLCCVCHGGIVVCAVCFPMCFCGMSVLCFVYMVLCSMYLLDRICVYCAIYMVCVYKCDTHALHVVYLCHICTICTIYVCGCVSVVCDILL